jgi:hypothetical protein
MTNTMNDDTCLQCGESGSAWDAQTMRCQRCGFDDDHGFSPVPEIFHQFARKAMEINPAGTTTIEELAAEYRRVFKTPEVMAQTWELMRQHPHEVVDALKASIKAKKVPH